MNTNGLNGSSGLLTDNWEAITRALLAETGIAPDPMYRGEIMRLLDSPGLRRRYLRKRGPVVDRLGELLWDRGATLRRPTCNEVLELLESLQLGSGVQRKIARGLDRAQRAAAADGEHALVTRKKTRLRLYECEYCRQKIRVASDELQAFHRHEDPDTGSEQLAAFVLQTITLEKSARGGAVPF